MYLNRRPTKPIDTPIVTVFFDFHPSFRRNHPVHILLENPILLIIATSLGYWYEQENG